MENKKEKEVGMNFDILTNQEIKLILNLIVLIMKGDKITLGGNDLYPLGVLYEKLKKNFISD